MKLVLLVAENKDISEDLTLSIPADYHMVECGKEMSSWMFINDIVRGVVLVESDSHKTKDWLRGAQKLKPNLVYVAVGSKRDKYAALKDLFYDYLAYPFETWELEKILERAWDKAEQDCDLADHPVRENWSEKADEPDFITDRQWAKVLSDFSRALSSQFNKEKFLGKFLASLRELVPAGKMAVILKDDDDDFYRIAVQNGLDPLLADQLQFHCHRGVVFWLAEHGRILQRCEAMKLEHKNNSRELLQEMKLLNAEVCLPMCANGRLNGVLSLGPKVTGVAYHQKELELLFSLCGNVAFAMHDLDLHQKLTNQKVYMESILQMMNSGVIAIDQHHVIMTFNQRAAEILETRADQYLGRDLRSLPSPLGDKLYATLKSGSPAEKEEVLINNGKLPVEFSTYRMKNNIGAILGSVMVIDDLSSRKKAEEERRNADQLEVLNRFVSQLTHEIKNPLVAIQTFSQLLPERYDDPEFREGFAATFNHEVKRLIELVDQLVAFSSPLHYRYNPVPINEVIDHALDMIKERQHGVEVSIKKSYSRENPLIKADLENLSRAFYYLFKFFTDAAGKDKKLIVKTAYMEKSKCHSSVNIVISDQRSRLEEKVINDIFNPLAYTPDNHISLGLPVSKKIIEDHEGLLQVRQPEEKGIVFGISLPVYTNSWSGGD